MNQESDSDNEPESAVAPADFEEIDHPNEDTDRVVDSGEPLVWNLDRNCDERSDHTQRKSDEVLNETAGRLEIVRLAQMQTPLSHR